MTQQNRDQSADPRLVSPTSMTSVCIKIKDGGMRFHNYPGIQRGYELDVKLDALLDEMGDGSILSPIKIVRVYPNGKRKSEDVRIYIPDD